MAGFDIKAAVAAAAAASADMNVAKKGGGGDYTPPEKGTAGLRFVGYIELGKHDGEWQGKPKVTDEVRLIFELSGAKWEPKVLENGDKLPQRMTLKMSKSLSEKAGFYKLFKAMNYTGDAKIMAQLLGQDFIGTIHHQTFKRADGTDGVSASFKDPNTGALTIRAPFVEDLDTGETRRRNVPPPMTEVKCFLWDHADKSMWDSIYIEGEYEERKDEKTGKVISPARSKNMFQERIREAKNFTGSPIALALEGEVDIPSDDPEKVKAAAVAKKSAPAKKATPQPTTESVGTAEQAENVETTSGDSGDEDPLSNI